MVLSIGLGDPCPHLGLPLPPRAMLGADAKDTTLDVLTSPDMLTNEAVVEHCPDRTSCDMLLDTSVAEHCSDLASLDVPTYDVSAEHCFDLPSLDVLTNETEVELRSW